MKVFDLSFNDGKSCRCIVLEESADDAEEARHLISTFHPGYVVDVKRVMPPAPSKLPWKRDGKECWRLNQFTLTKITDEDSGESNGWRLQWLDQTLFCNDKESISTAVRANWTSGLLT